jgi:hypothetical protein
MKIESPDRSRFVRDDALTRVEASNSRQHLRVLHGQQRLTSDTADLSLPSVLKVLDFVEHGESCLSCQG